MLPIKNRKRYEAYDEKETTGRGESAERGWIRMEKERKAGEGIGSNGVARRDTRDGEEKTNGASIVSRSRVHPHRGARPAASRRVASRLNAVKLSSYSHKGNSLSQPVKYKRVFPAGRFSTPIVFWAGLLFSVALRRVRATLP